MEKNIRKIVYSLNRILESYHDFRDYVGESSQTVRQGAVSKFGWVEKNNREISSGGEITNELSDIVNKLAEEFSKVSPNCKPRITAGNDQYHQDNKKKDPNYNTLHVSGQAMDIALDDKSCHPKFIELLEKFKKEYNGFSYLNEYVRNTKYTNAPHFHISYRPGNPEGSGKGTTAPPTNGDTSTVTNASALGSTQTDPSFSPASNVEVDTGLTQFASGFGKMLGMKESLSENVVFGTNTIFDGTRTIIPHTLNKYIYSAIDGTVKRFPFSQKCTDSVYIESWDGNYGIQYCGINDVKKSIGDDVMFNDIIGKTSQDIYVVLYNRRGKIMDPKIVVLSKKPSVGGTGSNNKGDDEDDDDKNKKPYVEPEYPDAALAALFRLPFLPFTDSKDKKTGKIKKNWASPTSKNQPEKSSWFKSPTSKNESKLNEEIIKIKKLLK